MDKRIIETIELENGLKLELFDKSRRVAGDRFLVAFAAGIRFDLKQEHVSGDGMPKFEEVKKALGDEIVYTYDSERNFIAENEVGDVFRNLKQNFLENSLEYLSNPEFPSKLVLRKYRQSQTFTPAYLRV